MALFDEAAAPPFRDSGLAHQHRLLVIAKTRNVDTLIDYCLEYYNALRQDPDNSEKEDLLRNALYFCGQAFFRNARLDKKDIYPDVIDKILQGNGDGETYNENNKDKDKDKDENDKDNEESSRGLFQRIIDNARKGDQINRGFLSVVLTNASRTYVRTLKADKRSRNISMEERAHHTLTWGDVISRSIVEEEDISESILKEKRMIAIAETMARMKETANSTVLKQLEALKLLMTGMSYEHTAKALNMPIGTVKSYIVRIKNALSKQLQSEYPELFNEGFYLSGPEKGQEHAQ